MKNSDYGCGFSKSCSFHSVFSWAQWRCWSPGRERESFLRDTGTKCSILCSQSPVKPTLGPIKHLVYMRRGGNTLAGERLELSVIPWHAHETSVIFGVWNKNSEGYQPYSKLAFKKALASYIAARVKDWLAKHAYIRSFQEQWIHYGLLIGLFNLGFVTKLHFKLREASRGDLPIPMQAVFASLPWWCTRSLPCTCAECLQCLSVLIFHSRLHDRICSLRHGLSFVEPLGFTPGYGV